MYTCIYICVYIYIHVYIYICVHATALFEPTGCCEFIRSISLARRSINSFAALTPLSNMAE